MPPARFLFAGFGQFNVLSTAWIPFYVWALLRLVRRPGLKWAVWTGVFLLFNALAEYTYASFVLIFTAFYLLYLWFADRAVALRPGRPRAPGARRAGCDALERPAHRAALALAGAIFLVGFSPFLYEMFREIAIEGDYMMAGWGFADAFSADLLGFFVPSVLHPVLGDWATAVHLHLHQLRHHRLSPPWSWRLLAALLQQAGALLGLVRPGLRRAHAGAGAAHQRPLHLRPGRAAGAAARCPSSCFHYIPLIKGNRYPSRYTVMLAPLPGHAGRLGRGLAPGDGCAGAAGGAGRGAARWPAALAFAAILGLVGFESLAVPIRLSDLRAPAIYEQIRQEPGDFTVLELPLGWRNGFRVTGAQHNAIMYEQFYQTTSQKRMLGGNTSRNPEFKFDYFVRAPLIRSLIALEEKRALPAAPPRSADRPPWPPMCCASSTCATSSSTRPTPAAPLEDYLAGVAALELVYDQDNVRAYRVDLPPAPDDRQRDRWPATWAACTLGEGWSEPEGTYRWAQRQDARLFLPLQAGRAYRLTLRAMAPGAGPDASRSASTAAPWRRLPLAEGWQDLTVDLPAGARSPGPQRDHGRLRPGLSRCWPASPSARRAWRRRSTSWRAARGRRRATMPTSTSTAATSRPTAAATTWSSSTRPPAPWSSPPPSTPSRRPPAPTAWPRCSTRCRRGASWPWPCATRPPPSSSRTPWTPWPASAATVDLRGKFRWGHVVIGVKGAAPGTALEAAGRDEPLQVYVGRNVTTAEVGLAVESVTAAPLP